MKIMVTFLSFKFCQKIIREGIFHLSLPDGNKFSIPTYFFYTNAFFLRLFERHKDATINTILLAQNLHMFFNSVGSESYNTVTWEIILSWLKIFPLDVFIIIGI